MQVRELYDLASRWDETAAAVPEVVARLRQLRSLHEQVGCAQLLFPTAMPLLTMLWRQAAGFSSTLTHIKTVQDELRDQLATHDVTLTTVFYSCAQSEAPTQSTTSLRPAAAAACSAARGDAEQER